MRSGRARNDQGKLHWRNQRRSEFRIRKIKQSPQKFTEEKVMGEEEGRRGGADRCAFCTGLELFKLHRNRNG